jgi:hypothetical protein
MLLDSMRLLERLSVCYSIGFIIVPTILGTVEERAMYVVARQLLGRENMASEELRVY